MITPTEQVIIFLREQLIGPAGKAKEVIVEPPNKKYSLAMLFPQDADKHEFTASEEEAEDSDIGDETEFESPISLAFQALPASMGISFCVKGTGKLSVEVWGANYEKLEFPNWIRKPIASKKRPEVHVLECQTKRILALGGRAILDVHWRPTSDGGLATVTLLNSATAEKVKDSEDILMQVGFKVIPVDCEIGIYQATPSFRRDEEDEELELCYSNKKTFAIGHGCAAIWDTSVDTATVDWIATDALPTFEVKPITTKIDELSGQSDLLSLQYLMDEETDSAELLTKLKCFVDSYESWLGEKILKVKVPSQLQSAKERIVKRINNAIKRMRRGAKTICDTSRPDIVEAFRLSTRAMLIQMYRSGSDRAGTRRDVGDGFTDDVDYSSDICSGYAWRPFQLAFQLLAINSLIDESEDDRLERQIVDLIWFPTGGGKTEAYLALAAFEIIYKRLVHGERGAGTRVIKRYTLRLLTTQQFERAAALISALEYLRSENSKLGESKIRLGLWVGNEACPNRYTTGNPERPGALELYEEMLGKKEPVNPFQLQKCPWCGTGIVPDKKDAEERYGIEVKSNLFRLYCPDSNCHYHNEIPVSVVDEDLFQHPPSLLIGTIDKFARMAWDPASRNFFGADGNTLPPGLIIQDELHLISGPLGTIAGIYESALESVITSLCESPPKIIAATATIRRADDQVMKLFARDVNVFPPSGIDADDSYFSRLDKESNGRMYIGMMSQAHNQGYALIQASATLAQAPFSLGLKDDALDNYWTQVIYHNSRRELGRTLTRARDGVEAQIKSIESSKSMRRKIQHIEELSANVSGKNIPKVLERLNQDAESGLAVDILPCTNMISVGVDINRLGLMVVYGQPKTTAEYIQASSRVGRDTKRPSGIVLTLYSQYRPRDRSHYESFISYHQSLYKYVEPTSVTPFAPPARERAMHAAIVIMARHVAGFIENESANDFSLSNIELKKALDLLLERMCKASPDEAASIRLHFDRLIREWEEHASNASSPLRFSARSKQFNSLLASFEDNLDGMWKTLNSMRNVDKETVIQVWGKPT